MLRQRFGWDFVLPQDLMLHLTMQYQWVEYIEITRSIQNSQRGGNVDACWSLMYDDT